MRVNTRYINSTRGTLEDVHLVEFMYLVFTVWAEKAGNGQGHLRMYVWWSLCTLYLLYGQRKQGTVRDNYTSSAGLRHSLFFYFFLKKILYLVVCLIFLFVFVLLFFVIVITCFKKIVPPNAAIINYTIGLEKLVSYRTVFHWCSNGTKFLTDS